MLAHSLVLGLFASALALGQPPRFRAVPLASLGGSADAAWDINERGVAVGTVNNEEGPLTAAAWDPAGNLVLLGRKAGFVTSHAAAINDAGIVAGGANPGVAASIPTVWILPNDGQPLVLDREANGVDVNTRGDLLLYIKSLSTQGGAVLKRDGTLAAVLQGQTHAVRALADDGRVTGARLVGALWVPFRWSEQGGVEDLELPPGFTEAVGLGIRKDGEIVTGYATDGSGRWPVLWNREGKIRFLAPSATVQSDDGTAEAVNALGWVVGSRVVHSGSGGFFGTLWFEGVSYELQDLIAEGPAMKVLLAHGMNEKGQIVGLGEDANGKTAIRLDPL